MQLDFRSPRTYIVLMACFFLGFFSFFLVRALSLPIALGRESQSPSSSALLQDTDLVQSTPEATLSNTSAAQVDSAVSLPTPSPTGTTPTDPKPTGTTPTGTTPTGAITPDPPTPASPPPSKPIAAPSTPVPTPLPTSLDPRQPAYEIAWADPSNYGDRFTKDVNNKPVLNRPIIVLHETVGSADSTIAYFKNFHPEDADQASYHTMIRRNGTVVYIVPPEKRAFGAGNSVFVTEEGQEESVKTHKEFPPSVNNFAYHISLESPPDGYGDEPIHSGYTQAQYDSLAWLIGQSTVPLNRITTHQAVDRSGSRSDPRSFEVNRLVGALRAYR